ncbi:MAG: DUF3592 domain-containing protein [Kordiimonadaceae bacterium]|nr:DUF3592 domain-containing protein [Kordiimonadaceae bacterium]
MFELIFDIIIDFFSAWSQIGFLVMGTVFLVVGGSFIGYELYWRFKSVRIKGRILAVRATNAAAKEQADDKVFGSVKSFKTDSRVKPFGGLIIALFIGLPLMFSGIGVYMGYSYIALTKDGLYAEAIVIDNESSYDSDSGTSYKAILNFTDQSGQTWRVRDNISYGSSPSFATGTKVGVYYEAQDPENFVIDDFWHNMAIAIIFFCFGLLFIGIIFLASYFKGNKNPKKSSPGHKQNFSGEMYHSTFQYRTPDGRSFEQTSSMSSNIIIGRMPGTELELLVMPERPEKVRKPTLVWLIFGIVFFIPGIFILNMAFNNFESNYMSGVLILAGGGYIGYKLSVLYEKMTRSEFDRSLLKEAWQNFKTKGIETSGEEIKGRVLETSEVVERIKAHLKYYFVTGIIMLALTVGLGGGAYFTASNMINLSQNGQTANGEIIDVSSRSSNDNSGYTYYAIARFIDNKGQSIKFEDSFSSSQPLYRIGEKVDILYSDDNPADAIIDRGIYNWIISLALAGAAVLTLWGALYYFTAAQRFEKNN